VSLIQLAADLLARADLPAQHDRFVLAKETAFWPPEAVSKLQALGLITQAPAANQIVCNYCDEPHLEPVLFADRPDGSHPFIACPANGRVWVDAAELARWAVSADAVAAGLAASLGTGIRPLEAVPGRCWSLGVSAATANRPAYLVRGSGWPDAAERFQRFRWPPNPLSFHLSHTVSVKWPDVGLAVPLIHCLRDTGELRYDFRGIDLAASPLARFRFVRDGSVWHAAFGGKACTVPARVGFLYIAVLLRHPARQFRPSALMATAGGSAPSMPDDRAMAESLTTSAPRPDELVSTQGRQDLQRRIGQLQSKKSSTGLTLDEQDELAALQKNLRAAFARGGRPRTVADPEERARTNVSHALRRAFGEIDKQLPPMALFLRNSIKTGKVISYEPHEPIDWMIST
jgi:hypothetical protein